MKRIHRLFKRASSPQELVPDRLSPRFTPRKHRGRALALTLAAWGLLLAVWSSPAPAEELTEERLQAGAAARPQVQPSRFAAEPQWKKEESSRRKWKKAWIASWIAFAAVNILDVQSSAGKREANPLFRDSRGNFNAGKAALLKAAIGGGFFGLQYWLAKKNPDKNYYKTFTYATAGAAGALAAVAIHNYGVEPASQASSPASGAAATAPAQQRAHEFLRNQP